jgi:DNA-binding CsgD family transcriptional regulator
MTDNSPAAIAEASDLAEEAVVLSRSTGSPDQVAGALRARSAVHSFAERYEEACRDGLEAAELFRAAENGKGLSRVLNNLACDEIALGRLDDAQRHLEEALPSAEGSAGSNISFVLGNLALVYLLRGDPAAAREPALESLRSIQTDEKSVLRSSTLYLALYHSAAGEPETAAVLHGAVDGMGLPLEPLDRRMREKDRHHLAISLGSEAFENMLSDGHALKTPEQVLAYVTTTSRSRISPEPPGLARLSVRERQLVALVAQGRTDAQIAAQLYISIRTVRSHLDRIRDKSGCRRRADLTRLALQAGLVEGGATAQLPPCAVPELAHCSELVFSVLIRVVTSTAWRAAGLAPPARVALSRSQPAVPGQQRRWRHGKDPGPAPEGCQPR